jgi:hypothetical protein
MSRVFTITVAFCPASQLARSLKANKDSHYKDKYDHYVVQGHYPINKEKNNRDIKIICDAFELPLLDPGYDLGSAQSQWWALQQIGAKDGDFWINLDPDSNCSEWTFDAYVIINNDPNIVTISCMSPMVKTFLKERNIKLEEKTTGMNNRIKYGIARNPIPFNLSMWRYSFFNEIGGIPQMGEKWGEVEGPVFHQAQMRGKYHAYLLDHMEDESGKFLQDRQLLEYKDAYLRTSGPDQFVGSFIEFLALKYPELLKIDTLIPENTIFK